MGGQGQEGHPEGSRQTQKGQSKTGSEEQKQQGQGRRTATRIA